MRWFNDVWFRIKAVVMPGRMDRELEDEMAFHREMESQKLVAGGMAPDAAEREARRRFGSQPRERERARESWGIGLISDLFSDVFHTFRQLRRNKMFTVVSVLTLSLGIGATIALATVVQGIMLRPLPFPDEDEVVNFWSDYNWRGAEFDFTKDVVTAFDGIAAFSPDAFPVQTDAGSSILPVTETSAEFFDVLQVTPIMGRGFMSGEDRPGSEAVMVISYGLWQQEFGGDDDILGRRVDLAGRPRTVVGVMGPDFYFPTPEFRAWTPLNLDPSTQNYQGNGYLSIVGRRADSVSHAGLVADIEQLGAALGERFTYPTRWDKSVNPGVTRMREYVLGDVEPAVLLLFGAVILVLVMACANAAALILARTTDRTAELTVRSALGAGNGRITRQILTESMVLALVAGGVGALLARAMFGTLVASLPLTGGYETELMFPWLGLVAAFGLALVVAAFVALVPIVRLHRGDLRALRGTRSDTGLQKHTGTAHGFLVGAEVVVALTLVSGAMLLIRSVSEMRQLDLGIDPNGVTTLDMVTTGMNQIERREFFDRVLEPVQALPGIERAGYINRLPVRDGGWQGGVGVESRPELTGADLPNSYWRVATPDYFQAAGVQLIAGRYFNETDRADGVPVALVSESFANTMWPNRNPIGQRIAGMRAQQGEWQEVVGVVEETRVFGIVGANDIVMYRPFTQGDMLGTAQVLVMKTDTEVIPAVRAIAQQLDPRVAVYRAGPMTTVVNGAMSEPLQLRFFLMLFAGLGLILGAVGVYGVVSYSVNRRRAEFGVRMAMGATARDVLTYVLRRGMVPVLAGVVVGVGLSLVGARVVSGFLYGIAPTDPTSLLSASAVLLGTGVLAAIIPAWRAGRTSPVEVLRVE